MSATPTIERMPSLEEVVAFVERLEGAARKLEKVADRMEDSRPIPPGRALHVRDAWRLAQIRNKASWYKFCIDYGLRHLPGRPGWYLRPQVLRAIERRDAGRITPEGRDRRQKHKLNCCGVSAVASSAS